MTDPVESIINDEAQPQPTSEAPIAQDGEAVGGVQGFGDKFLLLFKPDPRSPSMFQDSMIAQLVNGALGEKALKAELGQSVAFCADVLFPGAGEGAGFPPVVHLVRSGLMYRKLRNDEKAKEVMKVQPGA